MVTTVNQSAEDIQMILGDTDDLERQWQRRNTQMLADRSRINLDQTPPKTGAIKWYSNEAKVFYETATSLISAYPPRFRIPLTINYDEIEKEKISKAERFLLGIFRELDNRQMRRGMSYWLWEMAYWTLSGWYSVFTHIEKGRGANVNFIADVWDPLTVYPKWDNEGLSTCVRTYSVDKPNLLVMLGGFKQKGLDVIFQDMGEDKPKVINYWRDDRGKVYNSILIGGQTIKPLILEKDFDRIPIFCGTVGIPDRVSPGWETRVGQNIIAANRDMYDYENMMVSVMAAIMASQAYPNIVRRTRSGLPMGIDDLTGYGQVIDLKIEEQIELLKNATTPEEANILLNWVSNRRQKGSIPDVTYGQVPYELSGFAISQLMAAIKYKIAPYLNALQNVIGSVAREFLRQYRDGDFPDIELMTTKPGETSKNLFFVEKFTRKDIPETLFVEVTVPITSAFDKTQQILFARQAMSPPQLLSRETIWDEVLDVQDSQQEYARIIQDQVLELPIVKTIAMIEQLNDRIALLRAQGKNLEADAINHYKMMLEMQAGIRQGIPTTPGQTQPGGVPPQVAPPEATPGEVSPDVLRATLGVPSPGLSRMPQTPEQRQQTRRTGLVGPGGQPLGG